MVPTTPALEQEGVFILSGSDPDCAWDDDPAAARPGLVPGTALPGLWRSDYVQNSNDSAWMTNPAQPLTGYSPLISKQDEPQGGRTRMGVDQIEARRSEEHTSELQSLMRTSYAVYYLNNKNK